MSPLAGPVVVKPRFGSWGLGVEKCDDAASLDGPALPASERALVPHARRARAGARAAARIRPPRWSSQPATSSARSAASRRRESGGRTSRSAPSAVTAIPPPDACVLALAAAQRHRRCARRGRPASRRIRPLDRGRDQRGGRVQRGICPRRGVNPFAEAAFRLAGAAICARVGEPAQAAPVPQG